MIRPKKETKGLWLSIAKKRERLIQQTHREPREVLEFKTLMSTETFHFNPLVEITENWKIGLKSLEIYNSSLNITEGSNKFEPHTGGLADEFSYSQLKDKVAEVLGFSDISFEDLLHDIRGPNIIKYYEKLSTEESQIDGYFLLIKDYVHSSFQDFESYLRIAVGLDEDDIQLVLN